MTLVSHSWLLFTLQHDTLYDFMLTLHCPLAPLERTHFPEACQVLTRQPEMSLGSALVCARTRWECGG